MNLLRTVWYDLDNLCGTGLMFAGLFAAGFPAVLLRSIEASNIVVGGIYLFCMHRISEQKV